MSECRRYRIEGRVQGVWFRESTRRVAEPLGITGHALNLADGAVEVVACGRAEALARLEAWLRHGPPQARVDGVERSTADIDPPESFRTG